MTVVTLDGKRLLCTSVTPSGKKTIESKPNANIDGPVEAQVLPYENLKIVVRGVRFPFTTASLADTTLYKYSDLLASYKSKTKQTLVVTFGKTSPQYTLAGLNSTAGIPVVLESFDFPIDVTDSDSGYMPIATLTFVESA